MKDHSALIRSYARQARQYDYRWARYNRATLRATLDAVPWERLRKILNVSCGTGLLEEAVQALQPGKEIVGVDISMAMLEQARRKLTGAHEIRLVNAAAEALPFAEASFDAVLCANSFHFYRQPERVLQEFHRVLRAGGCLVVVDWCDDYLACKICDRLLRLVDPAHFRTYGMKECQRLLTAANFEIELGQRFKIDWLWGLMTFRAHA